jgi:hypothetical protein
MNSFFFWKSVGNLDLKKDQEIARHWWLMPVILATQEGRDQEDCSLKPAQAETLSQKTHHKKKGGGGLWCGSRHRS